MRQVGEALPTAIVAANDLVAAEALRFLRERGFQVPDDVAVVGFDDGEVARHTVPPLTTVRVDRRQLGAMAVRRLLDLFEDPDQPAAHVRVFTRLVVRGSCGGQGPQEDRDEG